MYYPTLVFRFNGQIIEPAPQINITKTPIYIGADQNFLSYTYEIEVNGYASSMLHSDRYPVANTSNSFMRLQYIKDVMHRNGANLTIWDNCKDQLLLEAVGSKITNFSVQEGNWYNYVKYSATFEFSELKTYGPGIGPSYGVAFDTISVSDPTMAQLMMRLKSYTDSWNFTIPENEAFLYYTKISYQNENEGYIYAAEDYSQIQVSYTINATGKHYYDSFGTTISAVEAAKQFVQYKLWNQIYQFRIAGPYSETPFNTTFYNSNDIGIPSNRAITSSQQSVPVIPPVLDRTIIDRYAVYNEYIDCSASETAGSFSATYNCVLKRSDPYMGIPENSVHTFNITYQQEKDVKSQNRTITINGSLQGMLKTNILDTIDDGQSLYLPLNGYFYGVMTDGVSKYANAYRDMLYYILNPSEDDLADNFKRTLAINYESLFPASDGQQSPCLGNNSGNDGYQFLYQILAKPKTLNVSHNYSGGSVDYSATYDTERACAQERGFQSITITENDSIPVYAEHIIVGRSRGAFLQNLNTNKAKTIDITIEGVTNRVCEEGSPFSLNRDRMADPKFAGLSLDVCDTASYTTFPKNVQRIFTDTEEAAALSGTPLIPTSYTTNYNPSEGNYTLSKTYYVLPARPTDDPC